MATSTDVNDQPATAMGFVNPRYAGWFLAHGLDERMRPDPPAGEVDLARGRRRLATWRKEPIFAGDPARFEEHLTRLGLTEADLVTVLGEPPETVRNRFEREPAYLAALVRAWTSADSPHLEPEASACADPDHDHHQHGFDVLAEPLFRAAAARIRAHVNRLAAERPDTRVDVPALCGQLTRVPVQAVLQMVARTVVLELNVLRVQGQLAGDTPEARFRDFLGRLAHPALALALLQEYPVLARDLVRLAENWASTRIEFAGHLFADIEELAARFPDPGGPGAVATVEFGAGDTHRGGRSVCIVGFTGGGRVVYKPRGMTTDRHFHELLDWLNERGQTPALRAYWILDRGRYGWTEFVAAEGCADPAALRRFYTRQGAYLALLHGLAATDFHLENLIAAGEHPVLVDLEALFHAWQPPPPTIADLPPETLRAMRDSVLSVGLLPSPIVWQDDDGLGHADLSGLSGAGGLSPTEVPTWNDGGTDEMHLVRRRVEMAGSKNLPTLGGEAVTAVDFRAELVAGYQAMYRLLMRHRDDLLAPGGPLAAFAADEIRVIVRPTRTYALLMLESYHPDLLRDALDRDRFFDNLWSGHEGVPGREQIIAAEIAQMRQGDVPMFCSTPSSHDLTDADGSPVVTGALPQSGMERADQRLRGLSEADLLRQTWFIEGSLTALSLGVEPFRWSGPAATPQPGAADRAGVAAVPDGSGPVRALDPAEAVDTARRVGDRLLTLALGEEAISWLGLNLVGERLWQLSPTSVEMFNGICGIALFLGYLGDVTGDERYRAAAERAAGVMTRQIDLLGEVEDEDEDEAFTRSSVGVFTGLGAPVYTLSHLDALWRRPDLTASAARLLPRLGRLTGADRSFDVIGGSAGGILAVLALHAVRPDERALAVADGMAAHLVGTAEPAGGGVAWPADVNPAGPLAGFSHGVSGIVTALARLDQARGTRGSAGLVRSGLRFERSMYDHDRGNWRDARTIMPPESNMVAWCHGAAGIGLARVALLDYLDGDATVREDLGLAARAILDRGLDSGNHSVCHGDLGNVEALTAVARALGEPGLIARATRAAAAVAADVRDRGWLCGVPMGVETPGLMPGLAGIGFNLLRLARPDRVPSVLLVEPPRPRWS